MERTIIGFDAKRAAQNRTGLGNYSRYILRLLQQFAPKNKYLLFIPKPKKTDYLNELPQNDAFTIVSPHTRIEVALSALWRTVGITHELHRHRVALYHGLSNELPLGINKSGCASVVTIHDVIFLSHPEYYPPIDRWIYRLKFNYAGKKANKVITVSEFSKQELIKRLHLPAEKIAVVYQGITMDFSAIGAADFQRVQDRYSLPNRFVLYVGTIEERKNLLLAARALVLLQHEGRLPEALRIVAVGRLTPYAERIAECLRPAGLEDRLQFIEGVPYDDLPVFYRMADFFVYPSHIEGFGIPLLEAATAGLPVIGCTGSSLEEAGGIGGFYVDPDNVRGMADCLLRLWNDDALRKERSAMGLSHAERFSDRRLFDDLMTVYRSLI